MRFSRYFLGTAFFALCVSILMFLFWPVTAPVGTVRGLGPADCEPEVVQVPLPFPVFIPRKRNTGPAVDPWKCWYSDRLEDWMCPVPAGGPWNETAPSEGRDQRSNR